MSAGIEYIGKRSKICDCCKDYRMSGRFFSWVSLISDNFLGEICYKCARRELFGTKWKNNIGYEKWIEEMEQK